MRQVLAAWVILAVAAGGRAADAPKKWNLLLVTADDMNADSAGWAGSKLVTTHSPRRSQATTWPTRARGGR